MEQDMATQPKSEPANTPEPLPMALLLAATGGLLDAVIYLNHGHVFANAMTGNVVLLGIAVLSHDRMSALHHVAPLVAFLVGVAASKFTRSRLGDRALPAALVLEIIVLLLVGWLPVSFPEAAFVSAVAFVSALQVASFRHVGPFSYNSTFITGNLRDTAEGFYDAAVAGKAEPETRQNGIRKARSLGLICLCFLAGAVVGAIAAPRLHSCAFWLVEPLLLTVLAMLWFCSRKSRDARPDSTRIAN
jgi:uncharacterized membrane protein YoaK (UPF0700 family)